MLLVMSENVFLSLERPLLAKRCTATYTSRYIHTIYCRVWFIVEWWGKLSFVEITYMQKKTKKHNLPVSKWRLRMSITIFDICAEFVIIIFHMAMSNTVMHDPLQTFLCPDLAQLQISSYYLRLNSTLFLSGSAPSLPASTWPSVLLFLCQHLRPKLTLLNFSVPRLCSRRYFAPFLGCPPVLFLFPCWVCAGRLP